MPNQRGSGQKQVIVLMKEDFLSIVDGSLEEMGFGDRADFIRTAVLEKLHAAGVSVEKIMATPPSRAGKGGRPPGMGKKPSTVEGFLVGKPCKGPAKKTAGKNPKSSHSKKTK